MTTLMTDLDDQIEQERISFVVVHPWMMCRRRSWRPNISGLCR